MYFYRGINYSSFHDSREMILDANAYLKTGEGYEGFRMPVQFYKVPYGYSYSMEQTEFLKAYKESAEKLGGDKLKKTELEINGDKIILRVEIK